MHGQRRLHPFQTVIHRGLALVVALAAIAVPETVWPEGVTVGTGVSYHWWEATNSAKGQQLFVPVEAEAAGTAYAVRVLGGHLYSYYDGEGTEGHSMADVLDTKVNLSYRGEAPWGLQWLAGTDLNLPTGRTRLHDRDLSLIMDPDLVPITSLGEGLNVNPALLLARSWDKAVVGIGVGYVWRGEYDYTPDLEDYRPGDIWRVTTEARWVVGTPWTFHIKGGLTWYGRDELDDHALYQPGRMWKLGAGIRYEKPKWQILGEVNQYWRDRDRFREARSFHLVDEERNGYGDETEVRTVLSYEMTDTTALLFDVAWLLIQENDYRRGDSFFRGERQKIAAGIGLRRHMGARWAIETHCAGFSMHDEEAPDHRDGERSYRGLGIDVALKAKF